MTLFNTKTINRHLAGTNSIPPEHTQLVSDWADLITSGRIKTHKETALHGDFSAKIVEELLGYKGPVGNDEFTVATEKAILKGSVDLALGHFSENKSEIIAPFELKGAKTKDLDAIMPGRAKSPVQQAWEYATNAPGVKWVLVSNYLEIRLYGFGEGTQAYEHFDLARLTEPKEYARFMLLLSADQLLSGKTAALLEESRKEDKDITNKLYSDYKALRGGLIEAVRADAPDIDPLKAIAAAQKILDRVLFTAFAEDTGLLKDRILERAFEHSDPFNPQPVWNNFKNLFHSIDKGNKALDIPPYNGGLFAHDATIDTLTLPDEVCEGFKKIGDYDFASEISVTVLGHIFEQSIADVERLQAIARGEESEDKKTSGTSGRRKRDGVVYTPDYIARFIVEQTLGTHLKEIFETTFQGSAQKDVDVWDYENIKWKRKDAELEAWKAYRDKLKSLRIVDPACGSGVFLVMAFDFMKAEMTRVNDKITDLRDGIADLFDPDSDILTHNLFGVDVNSESVEIAKLSLWVKTARPGKVLDSLDGNLKVGDSLIEDSNYAYLDHGFSWNTAFPEVFAEGGFDVVLGNPPYVRMEFLKTIKPYLETRYEVVSDRADLYCYFFERGLRLLKKGGRLGYISSSTFFKTRAGKPLRNFLRSKSTIESIVDFGDLQVFEGVATLPMIMTLLNGSSNTDNQVKFLKLESIPNENFVSFFEQQSKVLRQSTLKSDSWELEEKKLSDLRSKLFASGQSLAQTYGEPLYGIKTGLNSAFVIDTKIKKLLCAKDQNSKKLIKPFIEGKDLKRWRTESRNLWVIYIPKSSINIDDYPAIRDWLLPFKEKLEGRATKQKWFELQQAQDLYVDEFENKKIIYSEFNRRYFTISHGIQYFNNKIFMIPHANWFLLSFLQSNLTWFLFVSLAPQVIGGSRELRAQYVEKIPIPPATDTQKAELAALAEACQTAAEARFKLQENLRRRLPDLCPDEREAKLNTKLKNWWQLPDFTAFQSEIKKCFKAEIPLRERNDWEDWLTKDKTQITHLTAEIEANEAKINTLVYELFELTDEEIELLEENI